MEDIEKDQDEKKGKAQDLVAPYGSRLTLCLTGKRVCECLMYQEDRRVLTAELAGVGL